MKKTDKIKQQVDDLNKAIKSLSTEEKLERILFLIAMIHNSLHPENKDALIDMLRKSDLTSEFDDTIEY